MLAAKEAARLLERELRAQIASLEARLAARSSARGGRLPAVALSSGRRRPPPGSTRRGGGREAEAGGAGAAARVQADSGKAANELRYALRGKEKELEKALKELEKLREAHKVDVQAAANHGKSLAKEAEQRAERSASELRDAQQRLQALNAEMKALRAQAEKTAAELRALQQQQSRAPSQQGNGRDMDEARKLAEREAAARAQAEQRLREVKERLEAQQRKHEADLRALQQSGRSSAGAAAPSNNPVSSNDDEELRRAQAALEELEALKTEFEKKKEAWRISSLKRHAEQNKLEQALKVSQTNESLLKKKADMLELTVMSHQKSMDKGRASIVREQLKEHNERLEQQTAIKDLHANATQRKTFQETFSRQMGALDKKLSTLQ